MYTRRIVWGGGTSADELREFFPTVILLLLQTRSRRHETTRDETSVLRAPMGGTVGGDGGGWGGGVGGGGMGLPPKTMLTSMTAGPIARAALVLGATAPTVRPSAWACCSLPLSPSHPREQKSFFHADEESNEEVGTSDADDLIKRSRIIVSSARRRGGQRRPTREPTARATRQVGFRSFHPATTATAPIAAPPARPRPQVSPPS